MKMRLKGIVQRGVKVQLSKKKKKSKKVKLLT